VPSGVVGYKYGVIDGHLDLLNRHCDLSPCVLANGI
jgi:hypothetical protein